MMGLLLIFVRISGFTRVIHSFLSDCADIKKNPHGKENESSPDKYFDTEFITQYSTVMYNKRKYIKVLRSIPLSSISSNLLSNNDPFTSSHYSDSLPFPKQVILVLQLDSLLLVWLIHTPFLPPSFALRRKETETRGFASR